MNKPDLSKLTELSSFQKATEETQVLLLSLFQKALPGVQEQALLLTESATEGGEVNAALQYLLILDSPSYFTRPCRATDHMSLTPIEEKSDELTGYRLSSQVLEIITRFPDGICRQSIMRELAILEIEQKETTVGDTLARLRRKGFIHWEKRTASERRGVYYVYFLVEPKIQEKIEFEPAVIRKMKTLMSKGYSTTEIALRCGTSRDFVAAKCANQSRRQAS